MPKKLTQQEAENKVKTYNNEYELVSEYKTQNDEVTLKHNCGFEYQCKFKTFFEGKNKCPICYKNKNRKGKSRITKVTEEILKQRIVEQVGEEYDYISGFTTMDKKCIFKHKTCGHEFNVAPKMFLGVKQTRCPYCANKNRGAYLRDVNYLDNILNKAHDGNEYEWKEKYNNDNKQKLKILHKTCNREYKVRPNDFQQGYRCPYCSAESLESKGISKIKEILDQHNIAYKTEVTFESLKYKSALYLDIMFNNIIIEYDGAQHFKNNFGKSFLEQKPRDEAKNNWAKNNKYIFIRIPYTVDIDNLSFIILSIVFNTLNKDIIDKYNLYYYDPNTKVIYNETTYYTNINTQYFNETNVEPS